MEVRRHCEVGGGLLDINCHTPSDTNGPNGAQLLHQKLVVTLWQLKGNHIWTAVCVESHVPSLSVVQLLQHGALQSGRIKAPFLSLMHVYKR